MPTCRQCHLLGPCNPPVVRATPEGAVQSRGAGLSDDLGRAAHSISVFVYKYGWHVLFSLEPLVAEGRGVDPPFVEKEGY